MKLGINQSYSKPFVCLIKLNLEYFMQHPQQILTHDQIRARLWDFESDTVSNVVAAQIRLLRRKLLECGFPTAIETIRGFGYRFSV